MKSKSTIGAIFVALAALLWSTNAPFVKHISLDGFQVIAFRGLIAGISLLPFLRIRKIKLNWYFLGYLLCFAGVVFGVTLLLKFTSSPIAVGM